MLHRYGRNPLFAVAGTARWTVTALAVATSLGGVSHARAATTPRSASVLRFDHYRGEQHNGNGSYNRVSAPFNSPNFIHGVQHVINANSGGSTITQSNFCKKQFRCRVTQKARYGW
jgi:hypothetical protein